MSPTTGLRPLSTAPTVRWLIAVALLMLVSHEAHELAHTGLGRVMCGAWGTRDFNAWSLVPGCDTWLPTLVGPLYSWVLMWVGVFLVASTNDRRRWLGLACIFAPNPLGRLLPVFLGGGDEGVVARALVGTTGPWARILVLVAGSMIVIPPLIAAWRTLPVFRRGWWFALLFMGGILVTGPLLFLIGNGLLGRGILSSPGITGAPRLIECFTLATVVGLGATWHWLQNDDRTLHSFAGR